MFDFIQAAISHNLKDPHSKALEHDRLSPAFAEAASRRQAHGERGGVRGVRSDEFGVND